jgi:hypothetical protein
MRYRISFLIALVLVLAGCAKDSATDNGKQTADSGSPPAKEASVLDQVPDELEHDGFEYYGLALTNPIEYEVTRNGVPTSAGRTSKFVKVENGKAIFEVTHSGGLSELGTQTYSVEKDGVYVSGLSDRTIEPAKYKEVPASLAAGTAWTSKVKITSSTGDTMSMSTNNKVVGVEKVKVKAGEFEALHVASTGKLHQGSVSLDLDVQGWFVKGIGYVKLEMKVKNGGQTTTQVIEAVKVDK